MSERISPAEVVNRVIERYGRPVLGLHDIDGVIYRIWYVDGYHVSDGVLRAEFAGKPPEPYESPYLNGKPPYAVIRPLKSGEG